MKLEDSLFELLKEVLNKKPNSTYDLVALLERDAVSFKWGNSLLLRGDRRVIFFESLVAHSPWHISYPMHCKLLGIEGCLVKKEPSL